MSADTVRQARDRSTRTGRVAISKASREKSAKDKKSAEPEKTESVPQATPRHHLTKEGETLATLAEKYYGDTAKSKDIFEANKSILKSPEALPIGTDLIIPEVPITPAEEDETPGM